MAVRKEVFVCDHCGIRKRLDSSQRHWCEDCTSRSPVEMRSVRDRKPPERPQPIPAGQR